MTTETETNNSTPRTGKPKRERKRRNYAGELAELQGRVNLAVKLLGKAGNAESAALVVEMATDLLLDKR